MEHLCMKLVPYDKHLVSTLDTDGLVLYHKGVRATLLADYAPMPVIYELTMTCLYIFIWPL